MRRLLAAGWGIAVVGVLINLCFILQDGLKFDTDLMALLPQEEADADTFGVAAALSGKTQRQFAVLAGDAQPQAAIEAAAAIVREVGATGAARQETLPGPTASADAIQTFYFSHRRGLLSEGDRRLLQDNRGKEIADRALGQIFGVGAQISARTLAGDPFLLQSAFIAGLPRQGVALIERGGFQTFTSGGKTWVFLRFVVTGEVFGLETQRRIVAAIDRATQASEAEIHKAGTLFFAYEGAQRALLETSLIGGVSVITVITLLLAVFRRFRPLWLSMLAVGIGVMFAVSIGSTVFSRLHVVALLFGTSLIGTTVDYCMHYCCSIFGPDSGSSSARMKHVLPGIALGALTTLVGYAALFIVPFPGLHQIAAFSAIGIAAASVSVVLWFPLLDRNVDRPRRGAAHRFANLIDGFWHKSESGSLRKAIFVSLAVASTSGYIFIQPNDDIRGMQQADATLIQEQQIVRDLTGQSRALTYFVVSAPTAEEALRREEALYARLSALQAKEALGGYLGLARFAPSLARQQENRELVQKQLAAPYLGRLKALIGIPPDMESDSAYVPLTAEDARAALPWLDAFSLPGSGAAVHQIVTLQTPLDPGRVAMAGAGLEGVRYVDPAGDTSRLLGSYRRAAIGLLALSVIMVLAILAFRYGIPGALRVMLPPTAAIAMVPGFLALSGHGFSFFDVMALILVLAIGVDYAVFCAESLPDWHGVTLLGIQMAAMTSILSFGLLAFSSNFAVSGFGLTMTLGIVLAYAFAPIAFKRSGE